MDTVRTDQEVIRRRGSVAETHGDLPVALEQGPDRDAEADLRRGFLGQRPVQHGMRHAKAGAAVSPVLCDVDLGQAAAAVIEKGLRSNDLSIGNERVADAEDAQRASRGTREVESGTTRRRFSSPLDDVGGSSTLSQCGRKREACNAGTDDQSAVKGCQVLLPSNHAWASWPAISVPFAQ